MNLKKKEARLRKKQKEWAIEKELIKSKNEMKREKRELKEKMPTSKKLITFLFVNCTVIELFTFFVTIQSINLSPITGMSVDTAPLVTLIGAVVGEVIAYAIYSAKAAKENTEGGIEYLREAEKIQEGYLMKGVPEEDGLNG